MWCNSDWLSSCHHGDRPSPSFSSHVCSIASLSIFIEFMAIKEAKGIFLWKSMIFYPVTIFPLEKPFSVIVCIKYLFKIYLMAVIVWKLFKATAYLIFIDWNSFIFINLFLLNKVGVWEPAVLFLAIKYQSIDQVNVIQIPFSIPNSHTRFLLWYL